MNNPTIAVDMGKTCTKCGKPGATQWGVCLKCVEKNIGEKGMSTIKIERGLVAGVTANLLKNEVRLSLSFPLDDDILDLQDQLSEPAEEKTPVTVSLSALQILEQKQVQMRLDDAPVNDDEENSEKGKDKDNGPE